MLNRENTPPDQFRNTRQYLHFPGEIIDEILSRVAVKSLLRLRCVSKSWRSLIDNKRFIETHLKNSKSNKNFAHWRVIFNYTLRNPVPGLKQCTMRSYLDEQSVVPSPIDDPKNNHLMTGRVVGHCNGLLCILNEGCFFLWNPATRISKELPKLNLEVQKYGFGWDKKSGAYKVFAVVSRHDEDEDEDEDDEDYWIGKVYSLKTNSWKTVEQHGRLSLYDRVGVCVCGKIHSITKSGHQIEFFDLKSEVFGIIEIPFKPDGRLRLRRERWGCLRVCCRNNDDNTTHRVVWIMKKYGEKESWVKKINQLGQKISGCKKSCYYVESLVSPDPGKNH